MCTRHLKRFKKKKKIKKKTSVKSKIETPCCQITSRSSSLPSAASPPTRRGIYLSLREFMYICIYMYWSTHLKRLKNKTNLEKKTPQNY